MSRASKLLRNAAANWVGFAVNAAVTLVLTPFVLNQLGEARYGIWVISSSVIGYYGLLDLGFRGSINQYLTRYLAILDYDRASACFSTAVVTLVTLGVTFGALSIVAALFAPLLFQFPAGLENEAFWCILIVGLSSAFQFGFFPYMAVFTAKQRFDLANLIGISTRLLTALCVYLALSRGFGLIGISAATCGIALLDYVVRWHVARKLAPELRFARELATRQELTALASFGVWTFLISINGFVYLHAQPLLIGMLLPIAAVGHYALATGLAQQINGALSPLGQVLYPAATALHAQSDRENLARLYHDGSRMMMLVMVPSVLTAFFWAEDFYRLWIGPKFVESGAFPSLATLLQILLVATASTYTTNVAGQILLGCGRVRLVATLLIVGSAINLGLSIALIPRIGLVGAAVAAVTAALLIDLVAMPIALQREQGLRVIDFFRNAGTRPGLCAAVLGMVYPLVREFAPPESWLALLGHGFVAGASAVVIVALIGLKPEERRRFLLTPITRMIRSHFSENSSGPK